MSNWEKWCYANPGEYVWWEQRTSLQRPLFKEDRLDPSQVVVVEPLQLVLVVASFPNGTDATPKARGAIILVPNQGLWWWHW